MSKDRIESTPVSTLDRIHRRLPGVGRRAIRLPAFDVACPITTFDAHADFSSSDTRVLNTGSTITASPNPPGFAVSHPDPGVTRRR